MASEIKVDTISEKTSAGGVTIDGLLIKDGGISGVVSLIGTTPTFTIGDAGAEDATLLFDGNAQDFHIGLDDSSDDLVIGVGSTLGTTTALAIDANAGSTFSGTVTVGVDDTGKDVKLFGASAGAYMEWDESEDQLRIMGASADATTSTGKLLLATSLTDINANDEIGKIEFQAPHEAGGTDAITVAASIKAVAQSTFSASSNATDLIFYTGHSEAAAEKIRITSQNEIGIAGANYGTDGQVLTSGGAGAAVAWEDAGGGISEADQWRITTGATGDLDPIDNWERADTGGFDKIGTGMSQSSGVFSFPSTGYWYIRFIAFSQLNGDSRFNNLTIATTVDDGSNYVDAAYASFFLQATGGSSSNASATTEFIFDVTDTDNYKVKFKMDAHNTSVNTTGQTAANNTMATFIKLGDT